MVGIERNPALKDMLAARLLEGDAVTDEETQDNDGPDKDTVWIDGDATLPPGWQSSQIAFVRGYQVKFCPQ